MEKCGVYNAGAVQMEIVLTMKLARGIYLFKDSYESRPIRIVLHCIVRYTEFKIRDESLRLARIVLYYADRYGV